MKNLQLVFTIAAIVGSSALSAETTINPFEDEKSGWYVGGALGVLNANDAYSSVKESYDSNNNFPSKNLDIQDRSAIAKAFAGYRINKYIGIETDIFSSKLLSADVKYNAPGVGSTSFDFENELKGFSLKAVGYVPVNKYIDIKGSVGYSFWEIEEEITHTVIANGLGSRKIQNKDSKKGKSLVYGLGANYNINKNFTVGLQWDRMSDVGHKDLSFGETDIDTYTASFQYNF